MRDSRALRIELRLNGVDRLYHRGFALWERDGRNSARYRGFPATKPFLLPGAPLPRRALSRPGYLAPVPRSVAAGSRCAVELELSFRTSPQRGPATCRVGVATSQRSQARAQRRVGALSSPPPSPLGVRLRRAARPIRPLLRRAPRRPERSLSGFSQPLRLPTTRQIRSPSGRGPLRAERGCIRSHRRSPRCPSPSGRS